MRAWQAGDEAAGEELFERYFDPLYGFFRHKASPDEVADLVQQVLVATVEGAARFRGDGTVQAFIFGIAQRTLFRHYRSKSRAPKLDFGVSSLFDLAPTPSSLFVRGEDAALLEAALVRVPLELQVVIELRFDVGLTGPELADALDVPEGTARSRLRRAIAAVRAKVEEVAREAPGRAVDFDRLDEWDRAAS